MRKLSSILVGKGIHRLTRSLKMGGGSAAPGLYALKVNNRLIEDLIGDIPTNIVITGTNGKTTTARMTAHFFEANGLKVIRNGTGSNLERGIASTLISHANPVTGKISGVDVGIWELDEAAFNKTVLQIKPQLMVFLNAFRDQLDRYGEVDTVVGKWKEALGKVDWEAVVLVNGSDPNTSELAQVTGRNNGKLKFYKFGVKNHLVYSERALTAKSSKQIKPDDFSAEIVNNNGLSGLDIKVNYPDEGSQNLELKIPGIYHVYDLLAAFGVGYLLNLDLEALSLSLKNFKPAFGRVEELSFDDKSGYIFLIKNPGGANAVFETIAPEIKPEDTLLFSLNDNFADGTDVSWIWDAKFEILAKKSKSTRFIAAGSRAQDMAVRLKYAGFESNKIIIENDLNKALEKARNDLKGRLFILPTYTALLELQNTLAKLGIKKHYWQE